MEISYIPFHYSHTVTYRGHLTLETVIEGINGCRRLGLDVVEIILGQYEYKQMDAWTYIGQKEEDTMRVSKRFMENWPVTVSINSGITFVCIPRQK